EVGPHTFSVRAIDFEGNVGEPATYTWRLLGVHTIFLPGPHPESTGFTPPETPLDPATGSETIHTTAIIDFEANVSDATYVCSLDLDPFLPCTPPVRYEGLIPGSHMIRVIAMDSNGVEQVEASEYEWEIIEAQDITPPETSLLIAPSNNTSTLDFEFTGTDDFTPPSLLIFECRVDSTNELDWFECVSPFNLLDLFTYQDPQLAPGEHTFEVRARDMAEAVFELPNNPNFDGNVDPTPATHTWTMTADTTPPNTLVQHRPPARIGPTNPPVVEIPFEPPSEIQPLDVVFSGQDNATPERELVYECQLDFELWTSCESPQSVEGLEPGPHTFRIRAIDLALNVEDTPVEIEFEVIPAPVTTFTNTPPAFSDQETAIFTFAADQLGSTFECAFNGAEWAPCSSPAVYFTLENGTYELEVRATNPEGVVEDPPATYEWEVELGPDVTPPNTRILTGPANPTIEQVAEFTFEGTDNRPFDLTFQCALDGTAYNSCTSPEQYSDLTRGMHTLLVRARDAGGNFDPTPASYTWQVKAPPVTTILSGPAPDGEVTESTSATFTFASNVPNSTFWCWLDGTLYTDCSSPVSFDNLRRGAHTFAVLARDPDGIWELQWVDYEWTIGYATAPITIIESGPDVTTESSEATFTFSTTTTDPDVFFMCSLNGSDPTECESPITYTGLVPGELIFEVYATHPTFVDIDGEAVEPFYEPVVATYEWTIIDTIPPDTAITYGPKLTTGSPNAYFGFVTNEGEATIECSLDFEGFGSCESPAVFEDLLPGEHVIHARAVDLAQNADPTPAEYRWTIVRPAANTPVGNNVEIDLPISGGNGPAKLSFFEVSLAGATGLDELNGGPPITLPGYGGGRFFDLHTTAEYGEPVSLCVPYEPADYTEGPARLLAFDGSEWADITVRNDFLNGKICAEPEDFSLVALAHGSEVAPLATIYSAPPLLSDSGKATFVFLADVPGSMMQCSLDGVPFTLCESPMTFTHLETGDHKFEIQAFSPIGGFAQAVPTLYEWEVALGLDTTPPDTRIVKGPPNASASSVIQLEFTGEDDQTLDLELEFECLLDGILIGSCDSVLSTPGVPGIPYELELEEGAYGRHTVQVRAIDEMGNVDPTPATRSWFYVDINSPDTSID
ncbi:MAG TPA: hypothetical protein VGZ51_01625, partial [Actinomycetota bacterium]|nr:hypothetical protein [Actinomycetota bacterium]